jgi:hypothetical protein
VTFNLKKLKKYLFIFLFILVFGLLAFALRGRYVSDTLKNIILPELEAASGQRVTARAIYINLFPLFVEAKDLSVFDREGNSIVTASGVKGYINPSGFLSRRIYVRRLSVNDPLISTNGRQIEEIISNVKAYLEKERKPVFKVKMKVIEVVRGKASLRYDDNFKGTAGIKGLSGELILGETQRLKTSIKELVIRKEGWPGIACNIDTALVLKDDRIEIKRIEIGSYGSKFIGEGSYSGGGGALKTRMSLLVGTVKRLFNLSRKGEGTIHAQGEIRLVRGRGEDVSIRTDRIGPLTKLRGNRPAFYGLNDIFVNLKLGGNMYIETLMELLKVKEKIEGLIDFQGEISGRLSNLSGIAEARLQRGNLFGVDIDSLACEVLYKDGVMNFQNASGRVYNGTAEAVASIHLPVVDFFTVNVNIHSADSKPLLKLIGWEPPIAAGKVDGELSTSGREFNPEGSFIYKHLSAEQIAGIRDYRPSVEDFLDRIKEIKGSYSVRGEILSLSNLLLNTSSSNISANGAVDLKHKTLALKSRLRTDDIADLTLPYYKKVKGQAEFSGEISGTFDNPSISGRAALSNVSIEGYKTESIRTDFSYRRNLLAVREAFFKSDGEEHSMKGRISFPGAKGLFELSKPVYDLTASIRNAKFGQFARIFYKDFQASGMFNTDIKIGGKDGDIEVFGKASITKGSIYNVEFDSSSGDFSYMKGELSLRKLKVRKVNSVLAAEGRIGPDGRFSYSASSEKLFLRDVAGRLPFPVDAVLKVRSEGSGTFDDPAITLNATFVGGMFRGAELGSGAVDAMLRNKAALVNASLFDEKVRLKGKAYLNGQLPWSAEVYVKPGRYDSIISSFLKEAPEDLQFSLDGRAELEGDRNNISAKADINHVMFSLFGQTLKNESAISLSVNDRKVSFREFTVKSGASSFKLQGGLEIGREYDIRLSGSSSLSSFKALSKKIGYLKGDSDFSLSVTGKWEKPEINGSMNVSDASFGLHDYPLYVTSVKGSLFMEGDRIVVRGLSGKIGGGSANISGVAYLDSFQIKRFYLETKLDDVTVSVSKDFHVNFGGDLLYRGTTEKMGIIGEVKINRARYKEPLEWRSWLFTARAAEKPRAELTAFERAELNISVTSGENMSIDNNIARASVKIAGEMLIKGIVFRPVLFGRFETTEGYIYFRNNEFKLISASVDFADPNRIKPVINLTAETTIQGYRIRLSLEGQADRFTLSLSSQPHLEDRDILALLTSGQIGSQVKGLEAGIGAGEAASFLTGKLQDVFEERMRALTGVDRFQVEPYVSSTTGTVGPRVTVSKRLIGEKLFVTYANLLGTTEEQVIKIEYFLNKKVSLVGLRDETGSMGGDVRFRFEFK